MGRPRVSFCLPTYGRAAFIGQTLASVLAQTITDFEVVVVDDCSPDNTRDVVAEYNDPRIRYQRNEHNLGVPANLDFAMAQARGEFAVLLEDHDLLEPTFLAEALGVMERHPTVGLVATGTITIDQLNVQVDRYVSPLSEFTPGRVILKQLLTRHACPFSVTTLIRRSAIQGLEPWFDSKYGWYADQYLWLRLMAQSDFGYVPRPLLYFRLREAGHTLLDREWESLFTIDRIRRDNWHLRFPSSSLSSAMGWTRFTLEKLRQIVILRLRRRTDGEPWTEADSSQLQRYLPAWLTPLPALTELLPLTSVRALREWHRGRFRVARATPAARERS